MNILFRADSSSDIGTGHIMRNLVLAQQLEKKYPHANITFAVQNLSGNINHKIKEKKYKIKILQSNSKQELTQLIKELKIDLLVIDHYEIDSKKERYIKEKTDVKILSFDDTYEKHYCDILLNHNINAEKKRYKGLVPKQCEVRCGSKYTLLRDEFYKEQKKKYKKKSKNTRVFVAMGGADHSNINIKILKVLKKFDNIKVELVTTTANKHLSELKKYCKNKKWISLHINSNKIAKLMRKSDFAIVTPSVTVNEVYFMGLNFLAIQTADNQEEMYQYLKNNHFMVLHGFKNTKIKQTIRRLS